MADSMALFDNDSKLDKIRANSIWGDDKSQTTKHTIQVVRGERENDDLPMYEEFSIKPEEINAHPGLLHRIKVAMSQHSSDRNSHTNFMARLNSIAELKQVIDTHRCSPAGVQAASNKKQKVPLVRKWKANTADTLNSSTEKRRDPT
jgi:hypothetical protein